MDAKECLKLAYKIEKVVEYRNLIEEQHIISSRGVRVEELEVYKAETQRLINRLTKLRLDIEKIVNEVKSPNERQVLELRYLLYRPWNNKFDKDTGELIAEGIIETMHYSSEAVYKYHAEGLKKIKVPKSFTVKYSELINYL